MSKVTSKLQVTVPKAVAERHGIKPGDEIAWVEAGDSIRVVPSAQALRALSRTQRLHLFDAATARARARTRVRRAAAPGKASRGRGWSRAELYDRDGAR